MISKLCPQGRDDSGFRVDLRLLPLLLTTGYWFLISCTSSYQCTPQLTLSCREMRSVWRASLTHKVDLFTMLEPFLCATDRERERQRVGQRVNERQRVNIAPSGSLYSADSHKKLTPRHPRDHEYVL